MKQQVVRGSRPIRAGRVRGNRLDDEGAIEMQRARQRGQDVRQGLEYASRCCATRSVMRAASLSGMRLS
jgi:hypothetical protein